LTPEVSRVYIPENREWIIENEKLSDSESPLLFDLDERCAYLRRGH
jgi:hypothetical protein